MREILKYNENLKLLSAQWQITKRGKKAQTGKKTLDQIPELQIYVPTLSAAKIDQMFEGHFDELVSESVRIRS